MTADNAQYVNPAQNAETVRCPSCDHYEADHWRGPEARCEFCGCTHDDSDIPPLCLVSIPGSFCGRHLPCDVHQFDGDASC